MNILISSFKASKPTCRKTVVKNKMGDNVRGTGRHWMNAFPEVPSGQVQMGMWLTTSHRAPCPQVPGQGSAHLFLMQAFVLSQSVLNTHSGRQPVYGSPWYSGRQVQVPSRHSALGPHGDGLHGSDSTGSATVRNTEIAVSNLVECNWLFLILEYITWCS